MQRQKVNCGTFKSNSLFFSKWTDSDCQERQMDIKMRILIM